MQTSCSRYMPKICLKGNATISHWSLGEYDNTCDRSNFVAPEETACDLILFCLSCIVGNVAPEVEKRPASLALPTPITLLVHLKSNDQKWCSTNRDITCFIPHISSFFKTRHLHYPQCNFADEGQHWSHLSDHMRLPLEPEHTFILLLSHML